MPTPPWARLVARDEAVRDSLDAVAADEYWLLDEIVQPDVDRPFEIVWLDEEEATSVHYINDLVLGLEYVLVEGDGRDKTVDLLRKRLNTVQRAEVLERGREARDTDDLIRIAYLIAATSTSETDTELLHILLELLAHEDVEVRLATIVALAYAEWPESKPLLKRLADGDADLNVVSLAQRTLESLP